MSETDQLQAGILRAAEPMDARRLRAEAPLGLGFLVAAVALGLAGGSGDHWPVATAVLLVLLFAAALRVQVVVGLGYTTPVQLAFVPMLLLLPAAWVPLLVCAGWLLGRLPDVLRGDVHPDRLLVVPASCWFAIGPALVLVVGDATAPDWSDWPLYVAALAAQIAFDLGFGLLGEALTRGRVEAPPLRALALSPAIDALLSPLGLLAAFATQPDVWGYAYLLLVPPAALLAFYARERAGRLETALALAEAARERERLIAQASHELNTPLGVMAGLHEWLGPDRQLSPERRERAYAAMGRELQQLRQLIRGFADFTAIRTDRPLKLELATVAVAPAAAGAAETLAAMVRVDVEVAADVRVHADPERVHQLLVTLARAAMRGDEPVVVRGATDGGVIAIEVAGGAAAGPIRTWLDSEGEGEGLELYVARRLAEAQDGSIAVAERAGGGCVVTLRLPAAH